MASPVMPLGKRAPYRVVGTLGAVLWCALSLHWPTCSHATPTRARRQLQFSLAPLADNNCSFAFIGTELPRVNEACCTVDTTTSIGHGNVLHWRDTNHCTGRPPTDCSVRCATEFIPFHEKCSTKLDILFDARDGTVDRHAAVFNTMRDKCLALAPTLLVEEVTRLEAEHCSVNASGIYARRREPAPPPAGCVDDSKATMQSYSLTCQQIAQHGLCVLAGATCGCACKAQHVHRRAQISFDKHAACPMAKFGMKTAELNAQCCNPNDPDDDCSTLAVPKTCDVECAQVFIPFYADCNHLLRALVAEVKLPLFERLNVSCTEDIPTRPLIDAIGRAGCYGAGGAAQQSTSAPRAVTSRAPSNPPTSTAPTHVPTALTTDLPTATPTATPTANPTTAIEYAEEKASGAWLLSNVFGDHMVLHRGPKQAMVWGMVSPGVTVTTTLANNFNGQPSQKTGPTRADINGTWRHKLPAVPAGGPYTIRVESSAGHTAVLSNVMFGEVFLCGGQSNMEFSLFAVANHTQEVQDADAYSDIRLFTVGERQNQMSSEPQLRLAGILQPWAIASKSTVSDNNKFGQFSAVCWIFGRTVYDGLQGAVPIGLVSSTCGGSLLEYWTPGSALKACDRTEQPGELYNSMIKPYAVGPMTFSGVAWYQGESNTDQSNSTGGNPHADAYSCLFPALIKAWRHELSNPNLYFGFIQLSTWCGPLDGIPALRQGQMAAKDMHDVGWATNTDHGDACNIHPPYKQFCGKRLGRSALALLYNHSIAWRSPSYNTSFVSGRPLYFGRLQKTISITVMLNDVGTAGLTSDITPTNLPPLLVPRKDRGAIVMRGGAESTMYSYANRRGWLAWGGIQIKSGAWLNATVVVTSGRRLELIATIPTNTSAASAFPVASRYAWGPIPLMNAYDIDSKLPVLPWRHAVPGAQILHP